MYKLSIKISWKVRMEKSLSRQPPVTNESIIYLDWHNMYIYYLILYNYNNTICTLLYLDRHCVSCVADIIINIYIYYIYYGELMNMLYGIIYIYIALSSKYTDFANEFIHLRSQYSYIWYSWNWILTSQILKKKWIFVKSVFNFNCIKYKNILWWQCIYRREFVIQLI